MEYSEIILARSTLGRGIIHKVENYISLMYDEEMLKAVNEIRAPLTSFLIELYKKFQNTVYMIHL